MIRKMINWIRRLRLQAAADELAFLEARAPMAIEAQRTVVERRRAALGLTARDSEAVRRSVEARAKWGSA